VLARLCPIRTAISWTGQPVLQQHFELILPADLVYQVVAGVVE
jgi:hypothetical protein